MKTPLIVFDASYMGHHRANAISYSSNRVGDYFESRDEKIEFFRAMLEYIRNTGAYLHNVFGPCEVLFAMDGENYFRKQINPEYKAHRANKKKDRAYTSATFRGLLDILCGDIVNMPSMKIKTLEADDLFFAAANWCHAQDKPMIIVSGDGDLRQLMVYPKVICYDLNSMSFYVSSRDADHELLGMLHMTGKVESIDPYEFAVFKLLTGDKSDNVGSIADYEISRNDKTTRYRLTEKRLSDNLQNLYHNTKSTGPKDFLERIMSSEEFRAKVAESVELIRAGQNHKTRHPIVDVLRENVRLTMLQEDAYTETMLKAMKRIFEITIPPRLRTVDFSSLTSVVNPESEWMEELFDDDVFTL